MGILRGVGMVDEILKKYGVGDEVKVFGCGKVVWGDKMGIAVWMGGDFVNMGGGLLLSVGCIGGEVWQRNKWGVGVATTDPKVEKGLWIEE
ncbi:glutamate synthase-related protein, partial [Bacillus altitudinis]|uniref:glutamate synthase-related protein n=1 Tax=Bacillus altitudinis TaxID=293387 RepID=UPI003B5299B3